MTTGRKALLGFSAFVLLAAVGSWTWVRMLARQDEADYKEQLRLAWAEGLPTNGAQFASTITPATPEENAAPLYRQLQPLIKQFDPQGVELELKLDPSPKHLADAQQMVKRFRPALELGDQAARKPRCWFDRDWTLGVAVLMPEFTPMKGLAKLVALRGTLAAARGDDKTALANLHEILAIAKHAGEEGTEISALVSDAIYLVGLHEIGDWCVLHPGVKSFRDALAAALKSRPKYDLRRESRDSLLVVQTSIDLSLTDQGRQKLGLTDEDLPKGPNLFAFLLSQPKSRIAIVKAERDAWAALLLPQDRVDRAVSDARSRRDRALLAFPIAFKLISQLESNLLPENEVNRWRADQVLYAAVLRATQGDSIPRSIDTKGLSSPFDGRPVSYAFDGKHMRIEIDGDSGPQKLTLPSERYVRGPAPPSR